MIETEYLDIKHDCMWSGNCDRKCSNNYKMESLISKSPFMNENINDLYLNLCSGQMFDTDCPGSIELLDSLDSFDVDNFIMNDSIVTHHHNNNNNSTTHLSNQATYYQTQLAHPNSYCGDSQIIIDPLSNQTQLKLVSTTNNNSFNNSISHNQTIGLNQSNNNSNSSSNNNNYPLTSNHSQSSSVLHSSLCNLSIKSERPTCFNDLLLSSTSANIILTQHNQSVDSNSQLNSNHHQIANNYTSNPNHLDNFNNLDLIQDPNTNRCTELVACSPDELNVSLNHSQQLHTNNNNNTNYPDSYQLTQTHHTMMPYSSSFENHIDSTFNCNGGDSVGSSNNSECSSACLLERTDYDTDDIEEDLDLLEDIIEEEFDDNLFTHQGDLHPNSNYQRSNCRSIANSLESSSDVEMSMSSPISDSLINDHSYGASSNFDKTYDKVTTSYKNHNVAISQSNTHRNNSTLIRHNNRINKRRSLPSLNSNNSIASNSRHSVQRHSGTSLLMKEKQLKLKKVMDTDRRKEHNESERMRRDVLKNAFANLRNRCPKLSNSAKKSSRIQILNEATNYIRQINDKNGLLKDLRDQEKQRNEELKARLRSLSGC